MSRTSPTLGIWLHGHRLSLARLARRRNSGLARSVRLRLYEYVNVRSTCACNLYCFRVARRAHGIRPTMFLMQLDIIQVEFSITHSEEIPQVGESCSKWARDFAERGKEGFQKGQEYACY